MQILFDAFYYTDEYYARMQAGIITEEDADIYKDCVLKPILLNVKLIISAKPAEKGKVTEVCDGQNGYLLNIPFSDYVKLVPHASATTLKQKWAN